MILIIVLMIGTAIVVGKMLKGVATRIEKIDQEAKEKINVKEEKKD